MLKTEAFLTNSNQTQNVSPGKETLRTYCARFMMQTKYSLQCDFPLASYSISQLYLILGGKSRAKLGHRGVSVSNYYCGMTAGS